jgi:phosphoserine phosphatase
LKDEVMQLYLKHKNAGDEILIISASVDAYVRPIFTGVKVFGSVIDRMGKKPYLEIHCYREEKVKMLAEQGITNIDELYTDSISDLPMAKISQKIHLVKGSEVIVCNSADEFISKLKTN